jgi:transposase-like protein
MASNLKQSILMEKAVKEVFLEAWHGLCTFHILQNVVKHLAEPDDEESSTPKKKGWRQQGRTKYSRRF